MRELLGAGLVDSFGMSLGWTVLVLMGAARGGIAEAALYNSAMLVGVVLSAPVTGLLARRFIGRTLLRGTAGVEVALRIGILGALVAGLPAPVIAVGIVVLNIAAWGGFAAMRAEVTAVDPRPRAMTRYALAIAAAEAAGTGVAALLPVSSTGHPTGWLMVAVVAVYAGSLLPTFLSARRARISAVRVSSRTGGTAVRVTPAAVLDVPATPAQHGAGRRTGPVVSPWTLASGAGIMLLASGPTLLAVPLTTELHGRAWVAGTAIAFSLGCLISSAAVAVLGRVQLTTTVRWSVWGVVMLLGWIVAPLAPVAVLAAQFLAGVALTAFEGDMDARVASRAPADAVTSALAYSAATRAMGGAGAVRAVPMLVGAAQIGTASAVATLVLAGLATAIWALPHALRTYRPTGRPRHALI